MTNPEPHLSADYVRVSRTDLRIALSCFLDSNATVSQEDQGAIERLGCAAWCEIPDCDHRRSGRGYR